MSKTAREEPDQQAAQASVQADEAVAGDGDDRAHGGDGDALHQAIALGLEQLRQGLGRPAHEISAELRQRYRRR